MKTKNFYYITVVFDLVALRKSIFAMPKRYSLLKFYSVKHLCSPFYVELEASNYIMFYLNKFKYTIRHMYTTGLLSFYAITLQTQTFWPWWQENRVGERRNKKEQTRKNASFLKCKMEFFRLQTRLFFDQQPIQP